MEFYATDPSTPQNPNIIQISCLEEIPKEQEEDQKSPLETPIETSQDSSVAMEIEPPSPTEEDEEGEDSLKAKLEAFKKNNIQRMLHENVNLNEYLKK